MPALPAQWFLPSKLIEPQDVEQPDDTTNASDVTGNTAETQASHPGQTLVSTQTVTHEYLTLNGKVVRETIKTNNSLTAVMDFIYDESGRPFALNYSTDGNSFTTYYYILNLQGDVVKLVTSSGSVVASYEYDAWGNLLSKSGSMADKNPLRYRGYYYDAETGFYYLQSRYYDPTLHRFLNADVYASTGQGFIGTNMFAYCNNCAVMYADPDGHSVIAIIIAGALIGSALLLTGDSEEPDYIDPQSLPNPESGYKAPKKNPNPRKVPNPNGRGYGWPADDGGVWVPDNGMDGGPGWTVQYPGGRHEHHYPNGKIRTHKSVSTENTFSLTQKILGTAAAGALVLVIAGDDLLGIAYDDLLIPGLIDTIGQFWK